MANPIDQFQIKPIEGLDLGVVVLPFLGEQRLAFTNSHVAMTIAFGLVVLFLHLATAKPRIVPGRLQTTGEALFGMIDSMTGQIIGHEGRRYMPFVFTLFMLILAMNMLGMFLTFTATSQLAVTGTYAGLTILLVLAVGFSRNGLRFFLLFWPAGAPLLIRPLVGLIEFVSFLLRPLTLALRLFGIMLGGHVAMKIFAGFVVTMGAAALGGVGFVQWIALPVAGLSMGMVVFTTALEFVVAFLQAFVFAILATLYLNEVVNLGEGH
ncbi:F0F1 ATP synthase subunit A [Caulobacter mirabilis]|uniref:ATP synthase subunit a n=1 Tax=Caulobacter mirabilis TaxID=69666 RepID=A0A2D2AYD8_9CAUL|nr:F0F1 ATP synthase subunit A [Caulobacter mirabilis]ATQ43026.1 F0F1 ATP synthase subunit A [Caulobacter mirabilis]